MSAFRNFENSRKAIGEDALLQSSILNVKSTQYIDEVFMVAVAIAILNLFGLPETTLEKITPIGDNLIMRENGEVGALPTADGPIPVPGRANGADDSFNKNPAAIPLNQVRKRHRS